MIRHALAVIALSICTHASAKPVAVPDEDRAAARAETLTGKYQLTTDKIDCLEFETSDERSYFLVRVRENHTQECGGDPNVSPTLFFLKIRKSDGRALTNAYDGVHFVRLKRVHEK
ncbi:hypothetical protein N0A02_01385 [Paraburkholderia acidicola]|uniref:Uncharacterized protein n=1 Tax=Paraburkholderia acidicola TaxID=1912599 RepID=A0ABV1LG95_9BURK